MMGWCDSGMVGGEGCRKHISLDFKIKEEERKKMERKMGRKMGRGGGAKKESRE